MKPYLKMTHYNQPLIIPRGGMSGYEFELFLLFRNWPSNSSNNGIRILFQMIFVYNQVFDFLRNQY